MSVVWMVRVLWLDRARACKNEVHVTTHVGDGCWKLQYTREYEMKKLQETQMLRGFKF